jgi:hypothetical protein
MTGELSYSFIALCAILDSKLMKDGGYNQGKGMGSHRLRLWEKMGNGDFPESAKATNHSLIPSKKPVTDPQAKAELEQENNSESPFTLIVNLNAWRKIVEAHSSLESDKHADR